MTNDEDLGRLRQGVAVWNAWRAQNRDRSVDLIRADLLRTDLSGANLSGASLHEADLHEAKLRGTNLEGADLRQANLESADLKGANLRETNLIRANFHRANLFEADLVGANIIGANLFEADLGRASLSGASLSRANLGSANLSGANLEHATLVGTNLTAADLTGCRVHGISVWDLKLEQAKQRDLVITRRDQREISVDDIELGQFIYLLLHNEKIRNIIDLISSITVLILGRFTPERKAVLDALREEIRKHGYSPVLFDFAKPVSKDLTGTILTLANMARFIIADLTDPSSVPHELATVIPNTLVPVQPILLSGQSEYAMLADLRRRYFWVLATHYYTSPEQLLAELGERVIGPAEAKVRELRGLTSASGAPASFA